NLKTRVLRVDIEDLDKIRTPAILHWDMNHFVVLKELKYGKVVIHDPAIGVKKCSIKEFYDSFTGIVLVIDKAGDFKEIQAKNKLTLFDLIKDISGFKQSALLLFGLSIVIELFGLLNPLFIQYVTDNAINLGDLNNLYTL